MLLQQYQLISSLGIPKLTTSMATAQLFHLLDTHTWVRGSHNENGRDAQTKYQHMYCSKCTNNAFHWYHELWRGFDECAVQFKVNPICDGASMSDRDAADRRHAAEVKRLELLQLTNFDKEEKVGRRSRSRERRDTHSRSRSRERDALHAANRPDKCETVGCSEDAVAHAYCVPCWNNLSKHETPILPVGQQHPGLLLPTRAVMQELSKPIPRAEAFLRYVIQRMLVSAKASPQCRCDSPAACDGGCKTKFIVEIDPRDPQFLAACPGALLPAIITCAFGDWFFYQTSPVDMLEAELQGKVLPVVKENVKLWSMDWVVVVDGSVEVTSHGWPSEAVITAPLRLTFGAPRNRTIVETSLAEDILNEA
jgi:hypothetical protein